MAYCTGFQMASTRYETQMQHLMYVCILEEPYIIFTDYYVTLYRVAKKAADFHWRQDQREALETAC